MNCRKVAEQLPWYLNETLDSDDAQAVADHLKTCAACCGELKETLFAWRVFSCHVPADDLLAFAFANEASGPDGPSVEAHLASCPECDVALRLIKESYQALEVEKPQNAAFPMSHWWIRGIAAAAILAILFFGLGWRLTWSRLQHQRVVEDVGPVGVPIEQPRADYRTLDLFPREMSVRAQSSGPVALDPEIRGVALTLHSRLPVRPGDFRLEIWDNDGIVLWRSNPVRQPDDTFTVILPENFLAKGELKLRLYRLDDSILIENYDLSVRNGN